jgi:predicted DNA-binding WGR domain protein
MARNTVPFVILDRHDRARNMARYYVLSIEPSLFGDTALVRQWGRQGRNGRQRIELFRERAHAIETLEAWFARKMRRGYSPRKTVSADAIGQQTLELSARTEADLRPLTAKTGVRVP